MFQVSVIIQVIKDLCEEKLHWDDVLKKYPVFVQQELDG